MTRANLHNVLSGLALAASLVPQHAFGANYALSDMVAKTSGRAYLGYTATDSPSTIFYNPANITEMKGVQAELGGETVLAEAGVPDVVHPHGDADQVRAEPRDRGQLPFQHGGHVGAVRRQVGQRAGHGRPGGEDPGQPPRPADPRPAGLVVVAAGREAVAKRDIA